MDGKDISVGKMTRWKSVHKSWYKSPVLDETEYIYLKMIEEVFNVKYPNGEFKKIQLTNHQAEFHKDDLAIKKYNSNSTVVIKSRNTSFTVNAIIRILTSIYDYRDQLVPIVRINDRKVMELIQNEFKEIIQHMEPIKFPVYNEAGDEIPGIYDYWPFNNKDVNFTAHEIAINDRNVKLTGYPANARASESIRGLRINTGLQDETNFMLEFGNIDVAMSDAARGAEIEGLNKGKRAFQVTYGTTRKGRFTAFNRWLENTEQINQISPENKDFEIIKWPALDPTKVDLNKSLLEQPDLIPIVPWHTLEHLEKRRYRNLNAFKEEYMAELVDEKGKLYDLQFIQDNLLADRKTESNLFNDIQGKWRIGIDPAYVNDYFSISIFNIESNEEGSQEMYRQYGLYYETSLDPMTIQEKCEEIIGYYIERGLELVFIDGNGPGVPLSKHLYTVFPQHIRIIRGNRLKFKKTSIPIKEFIHTNQIDLQYQKKVQYLQDNVQMMHFSGWKNDYNFDKSYEEDIDYFMGHGDTTISNGLALLPKNMNVLSSDRLYVGNILLRNAEAEDSERQRNSEEEPQNIKLNIEDKLKWYKKTKLKAGGLWRE